MDGCGSAVTLTGKNCTPISTAPAVTKPHTLPLACTKLPEERTAGRLAAQSVVLHA